MMGAQNEHAMTIGGQKPTDYRRYARRCVVMSTETNDLEARSMMRTMARRWCVLAARGERAREIAKRPPRKRMSK
jgi:hypothetical protein